MMRRRSTSTEIRRAGGETAVASRSRKVTKYLQIISILIGLCPPGGDIRRACRRAKPYRTGKIDENFQGLGGDSATMVR
jgi:hypothetical protein